MAKTVKYLAIAEFQPEILGIKYVQKHTAHNHKTKMQ